VRRERTLLFRSLAVVSALALMILCDAFVALLYPRPLGPERLTRSVHDTNAYYLDRSDLSRHDVLERSSEESIRVFAFGGSSTWGLPFGHHGSFTGTIKQILDDRFGSGRVEVVNQGLPGYALQDAVNLLEDSLAYGPDLVIIYSGHNEYLLHNATTREVATEHPLAWKARQWAEKHSSIFRLADGFYREHIRETEVYVDFDLDVERYKKLVLPRFRENLRRIVEMCRTRDIPVIFSTVIANDRDWQPATSLPPTEDTKRRLAELRVRTLASEPARRMQIVRQARVDHHDDLPYLFHVAQILLEQDDVETAKEILRDLRNRDTAPYRVTEAINDTTREVAEALDVPLFDAERHFEALSPDGIIGNDFMLDSCHPTPEAHFQIGVELSRIVFENRLIPSLGPEDFGPMEDVGTFENYVHRSLGFDPHAYEETAGYFYEIGLLERSAFFYERILAYFPEDLRASAWLAILDLKAGNLDQAKSRVARVSAAADPAQWSQLLNVFTDAQAIEKDLLQRLLAGEDPTWGPQSLSSLVARYSNAVAVWEAEAVDGVDELVFEQTHASLHHLEFQPVTGARALFVEPVDYVPGEVYEAIKVLGRGSVSLLEQPSADNGGQLRLRLDDGRYAGSDYYQIVIVKTSASGSR